MPSAQARARCAGRVQRALIWADGVDLVGNDAAGEHVGEVERLDGAASLQGVQSVSDAVHRAPESILEFPCVSVVVAVGQQEMLGSAVLVKPAEALGRNHRVDQDTLTPQVIGAHLAADALPERLPVPVTGRDLLHETSVSLGGRRSRLREGEEPRLRSLWSGGGLGRARTL